MSTTICSSPSTTPTAVSSCAVLYAEQAVQCALKGLLHGVGEGKQARGHGLLGLAERSGRWRTHSACGRY
ncbi:MAG: hypothetical protein ACRD0K_17245 [Egibacteraceae bacterium]